MQKIGRNIEQEVNCAFGGGSPKAPPPPPPPPAREDAAAAARKNVKDAVNRQGRASTILGGATLGSSNGSAIPKTLLGG